MMYPIGEMVAQRTAFGQALVELGSEFPDLIVIDPDVCLSTQTHLFRQAFPERFIQTGIAEQNAVGIAAGLSAMGYIPFVSAFAVFLTQRAGDQVRNAVAHPKANVKLNGGYGGLPTGGAGATHAAIEDVAVMRCMPNMTIFEPADAREVQIMTRMALELDGPVYLRTVRCAVPTIFGEGHALPFGKAVRLKKGSDITLVSAGMMTPRALDAARQLEALGVSASLLHMPFLKPLDKQAVIEAAQATKALVTVENHSVIGGLGSAVCEAVAEEGLPCRVRRIGFADIFLESGDDDELFAKYGMDTDSIVQKAKDLLRA
jgi:transketolase